MGHAHQRYQFPTTSTCMIMLKTSKTYPVGYLCINPFTTVDAIWHLEVITHMAICLAFVDKYFYMSQHSMHLF